MQKKPLTELERQRVLYEFNATARVFAEAHCVHELFTTQARRTPQADAVEWNGQRLTYAELHAQAARIAARLAALLSESGDGTPLVGLCAQRTPQLIAGVLGILTAAAAYVPIEPAHPRAHVEFIFKDTRMKLLITDRESASRLPPFAGQLLYLEELLAAESDPGPLAEQSLASPRRAAQPADLAYVLYTSGTTGTPKGVCVPHRAVTNQVLWASESLLTPELLRRTLMSTSLSFDACLDELFLPLVVGGTIVLVDNILALLTQRNLEVSFVNATPSAVQALLFAQALPESVRALVLGGESLGPQLVAALREQPGLLCLVNAYGPTECTNECVAHRYEMSGPIPRTIGRPIANTQAYVLDDALLPLPIGEPGELYIGGLGVAAGYLNRPELTAERFIRDPFGGNSPLYRTGDWVRWQPAGTLEFLGRRDRQVKVRGHRIELMEIERVLMQHPAVQQSAVVLHKGQLSGYVTPRSVDLQSLRELALQLLPAYAVPTFLVTLDCFPSTEHGKLAEAELPDPRAAAAPWAFTDPVESHLAELFQAVLGVPVTSPQVDFVALGGDSLAAVRLQTLVEKKFGQTAPLVLFFQELTVPKLAAFVGATAPRVDHWLVFQEGDAQVHPPLIYPHSAGGLAQSARWLAPLLDPDVPVHTFNHPHDRRLLDWPDVESMASFYVESLYARFPHGPYLFAGHSFGVLLAYEMARQIQKSGRPVLFLGIVDEPTTPMPPIPEALLLQVSAEHLMYYDASAQGCEPLQRWFREYQAAQGDPRNWKLGPIMLNDLVLLLGCVARRTLYGPRRFRLWLSQCYMQRMRQHGGNPRLGEPDFLLPLLDDLVHTIRLGDRYLRKLASGTFGRLDVPTWLFRAKDKPPRTGTMRDQLFYGPADYGWNQHLTEPVTAVDCEGDHVTIQTRPTVQSLGHQMNQAMRGVVERWRSKSR